MNHGKNFKRISNYKELGQTMLNTFQSRPKQASTKIIFFNKSGVKLFSETLMTDPEGTSELQRTYRQ